MALFGSQWFANAGADAYDVDNSAMFNDDDSEYLTRTPVSAGNQRTWTFSFWYKFGSVTGRQIFYGQDEAYISINENSSTSALINIYLTGVSPVWYWETTAQFRDPHAWYHIVVAFDSPNATADHRLRLYINGDEITSFTKHTTGSQNVEPDIGGTSAMVIGKHPTNSAQYYDGYLAEYIYINGQQLAPTSFGETDDNGVWRPIDVSSSGLFDASNSVVPTATTWTLGSTMSAGTGTLDKSGAGGTSALYARMLEGDFKVTFTAAALNDALFGVFDYTEIGTFNASTDDGVLDGMTNSFWYDEGQTDVNYGSSTVAASKTIAAGSVVTIERSGSTIKITDDGVDVHSFSQTFSGPVGFIAGHRNTGSNSLDFNSISFDGVSGVGMNGFYLPFTVSAGLGQDSSGSASTTVVQQNTYSAGSEINNGDAGADPATGMKFVPIATGTVAKIELRASSTGFSGVTVRLETDGGSGNAPSGTLVPNGSVSGITSSGAGLKTATFSTPPSVTAGTTYWIVLRGDTGTWGWQHDVSGVGPALGLYQGGQGYFSGRGVGHYVYMTGSHFTAVNSPTQTTDSPTANYAVMTPLYPDSGTASNGNLTIATAGNDGDQPIGSVAFDSSDSNGYYFIIRPTTTSSTIGAFAVGVATVDHANQQPRNDLTNAGSWFLSCGNGNVTNTSTIANATWDSQSNGGGSLNDYFQIAVKAGKIYFGKNNTWYDSSDGSFANAGEAFSNLTGFVVPMFQHAHASAGTVQVEFGALGYTHAKPTDMKDINAENLFATNAPAIQNGSAYFQATTYDGVNGANSVEQSGASSMRTGTATFQPDMVWIKRTDGSGAPGILDAVRTSGEYLLSSEANAEASESSFSGFDANGFNFSAADTALESNTASREYVAWQWLGANGTATPSGSSGISSLSVSANTTAGFSIGKFTAQSSGTGVVAHGLGGVGDLIFLKPLASSSEGNDWTVWHSGVNSTSGNTTRMNLNSTTINSTGAARVNAVASDTFTINDDAYFHGRNFVFYAWRAIPGYSKFGIFEGNGTTGTTGDGPFINLGFRPALFALKNADVATNGHWVVMDSSRNKFNVANGTMWWSLANGQDTGEAAMDFLSNGVKVRGGTLARYNANNETFIYMAWAENPFAGTTPVTAR